METERQLKDVKRALEGLRDGFRAATASATSAATSFSTLSRGGEAGVLARKLADASDALEDRCRAKAEAALSTQLGAVNDALSQLGDRAKFERRKALLLDLDSYKRKVKDLREKEQRGDRVDHAVVRDKEDKLRNAERNFTECNDELMDEMAAFHEARPEQQEAELLAAAEACAEYFCGAGRAFAPVDVAAKEARARPVEARVGQQPPRQRGSGGRSASPDGPAYGSGAVVPYGGGGYGGDAGNGSSYRGGGGGGYGRNSPPQYNLDTAPVGGFKAAPATFGGADPFATPALAGGDSFAPAPLGAASDPFAAAPQQAAPGGSGGPTRQAAFEYAATEAGELSFGKGDVIEVISEDASGWWQGRNLRTGAVGSFPSNYTQPHGGSAAGGATDPFASGSFF